MNIVITGGSKGIGKAIAAKFAAEGYSVFICSRNEDSLSKAAASIDTKNGEVRFFAADLSTREGVAAFSRWLSQAGIHADILVNNAGDFVPGSVHNEPDGALEKMINVNLYSAYHLTRALLPEMMKRKSGHIINMCSIASLNAYENGGAYSISKFALMGFSKNLREEMIPHNIKVTAIYPGAVYTDSWKDSGVSESRIMQVADVADTVYQLANLSPQACVEEVVLRPLAGDL